MIQKWCKKCRKFTPHFLNRTARFGDDHVCALCVRPAPKRQNSFFNTYGKFKP